jgi:hypothetical protein
MPTNKPQHLITFPSLDAKKSVQQRASAAGLSLNNYILRELGLETLQHGGARNSHGRKGSPAKNEKK